MTGRSEKRDTTGPHDREPADRRTRRDHEGADGDDGGRRVVDDDVPVSEGLTSPGEGMDDEPVEPRQSKDYA